MDDKYIEITQEWHRKGFEAGAASRQADVDELTKMLHASCDDGHYLFNRMNELEKRINDALGVIEDNHLSHLDALLLIVDILKGEQS